MTTPKSDLLQVDIIPKPSVALVGRNRELVQIQEAFNDFNINVMSIIAGSGVGKSALIWQWLQQIRHNYKGTIFGWSFHGQSSHQAINSLSQFLKKALPFFGFQGKQPNDDFEKVIILGNYLRKKQSILVLDSLESLQYPAHILSGELICMIIKELLDCVQYFNGKENLVLISSQQPMVELNSWSNHQKLDLQTLTITDGVKLLKNLGCNNDLEMLQKTSYDMGGHALALVLVGQLLKEGFASKIEKQFPRNEESNHVLQVLQYYDEIYWQNNTFLQRVYRNLFGMMPEQVLLQLLSLFDKPMNELEKQVLFDKAKLAKPLLKLTEKELQNVEKNLKKIGLLLQYENKKWDTYPSIRSYFRNTLLQTQPKLYRQANLVLFEYYQSLPNKHQPDTLEELEPLYQAVIHGCLAGEYKKVLKDVYYERILRGNKGYSSSELGAYIHDLNALAAFFPNGWDKPILTTSKFKTWLVKQINLKKIEPVNPLLFIIKKRYAQLGSQALLLNEASFCLTHVGRLEEAVIPRQLSLEIYEQLHNWIGRLEEAVIPRQLSLKIYQKLQNWDGATKYTGNFVILYSHMGQLKKAKQFAQKSIKYAYKTDSLFNQMNSHARLAATLHKQGNLAAALEQFQVAEKIQAESRPNYPKLFSLSGFQYCALLLDQSMDTKKKVLEHGQYSLEISNNNNWLLYIALDHLTIARSQTSNKAKLYFFNQAVQKIYKARSIVDIPEVLLARANFHRQQKEFKLAQLDLNKSLNIINNCKMKLYQVDALLLQANLNLDQGQLADSKPIKELITETGYHLRDSELDILNARIAFYNQDYDQAQYYLKKSRQQLEKIGYWRLLSEWKKIKKNCN